MKLRDVLSDCRYERIVAGEDNDLSKALNTELSGISYDSRKALKGCLFVAIKGENFDGHDFINGAIKRGAVAAVHEEEMSIGQLNPPFTKGVCGEVNSDVIFIHVKNGRDALACISNNFYKRPSLDISVIGVTGTNGKTTVTYIIKSILETWEKDVGLIGTIGYLIRGSESPALHTTPEAPEFQGLLRDMVSAGCSHVVTEVSSHALSQKRVDYTIFDIAVFTNLTRDHLDFHQTMENYYCAKKRLFTELLSDKGTAVINTDDEWGRRLLAEACENNRLYGRKGEKNNAHAAITYGIFPDADVMAVDIENSLSGVSFTLRHRDEYCRIESPLLGMTGVYNILASVSAAIALNVPKDVIAEGVRNVKPVKGRLENIDYGQDFLCIIDYAHTPDALERLISTVRELEKGKGAKGKGQGGEKANIITVFGCGGNRDHGKRPVMGEIAARLSDYVIITSDNPRKEDPVRIINEIELGITKKNYLIVSDRRDAINMAIDKARSGDIVIVAGKGHEDYQEIGEARYRFSDTEVVREAIRNKIKKKQADSEQ